MGKSTNSHAKNSMKSDKETQSPMLKIFKEIMQREKDSEKANLLTDKRKTKKKKTKPPSTMVSRSELCKKSFDSSGNERRRLRTDKDIAVQYQVQEKGRAYSQQTQSIPFQSEKRESWWFWNSECQKTNSNETCSCVSCALKRLISNDYACVACLLFVFTVSALCGFLVICKAVPIITANSENTQTDRYHTTAMPESYDKLLTKRMSIPGYLKDDIRGRRDRGLYGNIRRNLEGVSGGSDNEFIDTNLQESNGYADTGNELSYDLLTALESNNNWGDSSNVLKEFYKKLVQTDAQINKLKQGIFEGSKRFDIEVNSNQNPDRHKRSLKNRIKNIFHHKHKKFHEKVTNYSKPAADLVKPGNLAKPGDLIKPGGVVKPGDLLKPGGVVKPGEPGDLVKPKIQSEKTKGDKKNDEFVIKINDKEILPTDNNRVKRMNNISQVPSGIIFEKKKLLVKFDGKRKILPNTEAVKDLKFDENQLKYPFGKNSKKLDELLDQILDKKIPDVSDAGTLFNVDMPPKFQKCKHPYPKIPIQDTYSFPGPYHRNYIKSNVKKAKKFKSELLRLFQSDEPMLNDMSSNRPYTKKFVKKKSTAPSYELILSISTVLKPSIRDVTSPSTPLSTKFLSRKLLQVDDEEEEGIGYDEIKEVLSDEMQGHDETDRQVERKKRDRVIMAEQQVIQLKNLQNLDDQVPGSEVRAPAPLKYIHPPGVHNPNWKGPMPLYPDEINTIIKTAAMENVEKQEDQELPQVPINTKDSSGETEKSESEISDVQYIEDYLNNKHDKLVEMAQAYSDYGVLDGKKDNIRAEKPPATNDKTEEGVKMSAETAKLFNNYLFGRAKKEHTDTSESVLDGFKLSVSRGPITPLFNTKDVANAISKHIKFKSGSEELSHPASFEHYTTLMPINESEVFLVGKSKSDESNKYKYSLGRLKRSLKSVDYEEKLTQPDDIDSKSKVEIASEIPDEINFDNIRVDNNIGLYNRVNTNTVQAISRINDVKCKRSVNTYGSGEIDISDESTTLNYNDTKVIASFMPAAIFNMERVYNNLDHNDVKSKVDSKVLQDQRPINSINIEDTTSDYNHNKSNSKIIIINNKLVNDSQDGDKIALNPKISMKINSNNLNGTPNIRNTREETKSDEKQKDVANSAKFLMMMSDFFGALAGMSFSKNNTKSDPHDHLINLLTKVIERNDTKQTANVTRDLEYPIYDSFMVDNIGHRSRVLMSVEDEHLNTSEKYEMEDISIKGELNSEVPVTASGHSFGAKTTTNLTFATNATTNTTNVKLPKTVTLIDTKKKNESSVKVNKTISRRNAIEDSNLIFWNDIYDDEYGIQVDPLDKAIEGNNGQGNSEITKKSGQWLQDKVRKLTDTVKRKSRNGFHRFYGHNSKIARRRRSRDVRSAIFDSKKDRRGNRNNDFISNLNERETEWDHKTFAALTARMKEVCKEAAQAVQHTTNIEGKSGNQNNQVRVKDESQEAAVSASLMQQLVKLMADLVDYQVQLKTCLKLPPDLQEFLGWLTMPALESQRLAQQRQGLVLNQGKQADEKPGPEFLTWLSAPAARREGQTAALGSYGANVVTKAHMLDTKPTEAPLVTPEPIPVMTGERDTSDTRSECLGTLRAVEELIRQYEQMSEEDKSKMTGIKEYLENQWKFLTKQLSENEDFKMNVSPLRELKTMRFRRALYNNRRYATHGKKNRRHRKRHNNQNIVKNKGNTRKFVRNFDKKHTRSTANSFDAPVQVNAETFQKWNTVSKLHEDKLKNTDNNDDPNDTAKRNLKDVYYHAMAEAKKFSTAKVLHKKNTVAKNFHTTAYEDHKPQVVH